MAVTPLYNYFVYNDKIHPNAEFVPSENEGGIYEVLRVAQGVPLFLEDHLERFYHSAEIAKLTVSFSGSQIEALLKDLIKNNEIYEGNILISYKKNLKAFFIPHNYPTTEMYQNGVVCGILKAERENPNAKVFQTIVRESANKMIQQHGFYEVILVDHFGRITEGSRSNVFFISDNKLVTAPGNEVLLGITREKTIRLAKELKIDFSEEDIWLKNLEDFSAAIITGTSPKILPVKQIGEVKFNPENKIIRGLMNGYERMIREYIGDR